MRYFLSWSLVFAFASVCVAQAQDNVKNLKSEVQELKQQVRELQKQLEIAEHNGFYWPGEPAIGSALPLVKGLPKNLKLQRGEYWDKFALQEVNEELKQNNGKPFAARLRLSSLSVTESNRKGIYEVRFNFSDSSFSLRGHDFKIRYNRFHTLVSSYKCDLETAEAIKEIDRKKLVPVSGLISSIDLKGTTFDFHIKRIILDSVKLP